MNQHRSVLVIGDQPEKQLEVFSETPRRIVDNDELKAFRKAYRDKRWEQGCAGVVLGSELSLRELYRRVGREYNDKAWYFDEKAGVWFDSTSTNPKLRLSEYEIGGKYESLLILKNGRRDSQAYFGDIDWPSVHMAQGELERLEREWGMLMGESEMDEHMEHKGSPGYYQTVYGDAKTFMEVNASFHTDALVERGDWYEKSARQCGIKQKPKRQDFAWELGYFEKFIRNRSGGDLITVADYTVAQ